MSELRVQTSRGEYPVHIGVDILTQALPEYDFALVDEAVANTFASDTNRLMMLSASESNKSLATCETVLQSMRTANCDRASMFVAIGGGVVQDVATLCASLYMRGIKWMYVPTTFMAMADSCIGGKSSINVAGVKNLVGNIYPPQGVIVDLAFTRTLSPAAIASGLAEAVKICFARGPQPFAQFCELRNRVTSMDSREGAALVTHTLRCKQWFIEVDEFDRAERRLLNFGHTFAHAIESATYFAIPHGIAVAIGVLAALQHPATKRGPGEDALALECQAILVPLAQQLVHDLDALDWDAFEAAISQDKKHTSHEFHLILPNEGTLHEVRIPRTPRAIADIIAAVTAATAGLIL